MIIEYGDKNIEKLCTDIKESSKVLPTQVAKSLKLLMYNLYSTDYIVDFFKTDYLRKKYRTHYLKGDRKKQISLSLGNKYRTVIIELQNSSTYGDRIKIIEVGNHYGD